MVSLRHRVAGFAACLALLGLIVTAITPAAAQPLPAIVNPSQANAAADYLVKQLVDGNHLNSSYTGQPDVGATSDALLGLVASGSHDREAMDIAAWLQTQASTYAAQGAGASGKLILVAAAVGGEPTTWGGVNLVALTTDSLATDPTAGSSSFGAALAVLGLRTAGAEVPTPAVAALLAAQDPTGAFGFVTDGAFTADVDTTALVIQALQRMPAAPATDAALRSALAWLQAQLSGDHWTTYSPANTAGLAIPALMVAGVDVSAPMAWLLNAQLGDGGFAASAGGTTSDAYATAQAILGVAGVSLGTEVLEQPTVTPTPSTPGPATTGAPEQSSPSASAAPTNPGLPDTGDSSSRWALLIMLVVVVVAARSLLRRR